jgi:hypothetical protein
LFPILAWLIWVAMLVCREKILQKQFFVVFTRHCEDCIFFVPSRLYTWLGGLLLIVATVVTQMASQQSGEGADNRRGDTELVRTAAPHLSMYRSNSQAILFMIRSKVISKTNQKEIARHKAIPVSEPRKKRKKNFSYPLRPAIDYYDSD